MEGRRICKNELFNWIPRAHREPLSTGQGIRAWAERDTTRGRPKRLDRPGGTPFPQLEQLLGCSSSSPDSGHVL